MNRSYVFILLGAFSFSLLVIFSKIASDQMISPFSQIFWRVIFAAIVSLIVMTVAFKQDLKLKRKEFEVIALPIKLATDGATV